MDDRAGVGPDPETTIELVRRAASGDERKFRRLSPFLTGTGDPSGYLLAERELDLSEAATKGAVHRLRKRFGAVLREELANTVGSSERIDEEFRDVLAILGA